MADAETAAMLLRPFRIESLTVGHVNSLGKIAEGYGQQWMAELLRTWFDGHQSAWVYGGARERPQWVAEQLPGLCAGLHATGRAGAAAAQRLLDLALEWISKEIRSGLALSPPSRRDRELGELGKPLAALLTAIAVVGAESTLNKVAGYIRQQDDSVAMLELSALRAVVEPPRDRAQGDAGFGALAADCATRLRARLARPQRAPGDWAVELPAGCTCELCGTLRAFLADPGRRAFDWPLAKDGRQHIHARIDGAELPVTHVTRRQGRPYTLVLNKTDALFTREQESRATDETDMTWLATAWNVK
jgi:hypothetical protein